MGTQVIAVLELFCIDSYFGCAAVRVVYPVRTMVVTAAEDPTQSMHACSCAGNSHELSTALHHFCIQQVHV